MGLIDLIKDIKKGRFFVETKVKSKNDLYHNVESSDYVAIEYIFKNIIKPSSSDIIVDVGCGTGRVIEWLYNNVEYKKIIGYEVERKTANNVAKRFSEKRDIYVHNKDIFDCFPVDANIFYLYNPFPEKSVVKFVEFITKLYVSDIEIVYYNPVYINVFTDNAFYEIKEIEIADGVPWVAIIHKKNTILK